MEDSSKLKFVSRKPESELEEKLKKKHGSIATSTDADLYNILLFFKDKKYFSQFYNKNLEITKSSIKDSVNNDALIIQTISSIEEIDKTINLLTKRLREWYALYNPPNLCPLPPIR